MDVVNIGSVFYSGGLFVRSHFEPLREVFEITHYYWLQSLFPSPKVVPSKGDVRYSLFYGGGGYCRKLSLIITYLCSGG